MQEAENKEIIVIPDNNYDSCFALGKSKIILTI